MQSNDDIAFQKAILENPSDMTLKLIYADWLQDHSDPRAKYVRLQLDGMEEPRSELAMILDQSWVGFMESLAQPFDPSEFEEGDPFLQPIGRRGRIVVFETQYRTASAWNEGLLADCGFLTGIDWGECVYTENQCPMNGFMCDISTGVSPLTARNVLGAIKASFRSTVQSFGNADLEATEIDIMRYPEAVGANEIHTQFDAQHMFSSAAMGWTGEKGTHGMLKRYVIGRLWYVRLRSGAGYTLLTVGRSPYGNRLVGVISSAAEID